MILFLIVTASSLKDDKINNELSKLTLNEKIGQLFVIHPEAIDPDLSLVEVNSATVGLKELTHKMKSYYKRYPAGGFILFDKNLSGQDQLIKFNNDLHALGKIRPFIYVDEEGGKVARIANNKHFDVPRFDPMYLIAQKKDEKLAYEVGNTIGKYLSELGFDVNFAPDADVYYENGNSVIGYRAFSSNPEVAGNMAVQVLKGLEANNIKGCFKHFPGHGACTKDTHFDFGVVYKTWEEILNTDIIPFNKGIENNVPFIMVSHVNYPYVTNDELPASLSYTLLTEKLRNELNYKGLIITDGMSMGAIHKNYDDETAAVMAIKAGVDIILVPFAYEDAFNSLVRAVKKGEISEQRINESVYRILSLKLN